MRLKSSLELAVHTILPDCKYLTMQLPPPRSSTPPRRPARTAAAPSPNPVGDRRASPAPSPQRPPPVAEALEVRQPASSPSRSRTPPRTATNLAVASEAESAVGLPMSSSSRWGEVVSSLPLVNRGDTPSASPSASIAVDQRWPPSPEAHTSHKTAAVAAAHVFEKLPEELQRRVPASDAELLRRVHTGTGSGSSSAGALQAPSPAAPTRRRRGSSPGTAGGGESLSDSQFWRRHEQFALSRAREARGGNPGVPVPVPMPKTRSPMPPRAMSAPRLPPASHAATTVSVRSGSAVGTARTPAAATSTAEAAVRGSPENGDVVRWCEEDTPPRHRQAQAQNQWAWQPRVLSSAAAVTQTLAEPSPSQEKSLARPRRALSVPGMAASERERLQSFKGDLVAAKTTGWEPSWQASWPAQEEDVSEPAGYAPLWWCGGGGSGSWGRGRASELPAHYFSGDAVGLADVVETLRHRVREQGAEIRELRAAVAARTNLVQALSTCNGLL